MVFQCSSTASVSRFIDGSGSSNPSETIDGESIVCGITDAYVVEEVDGRIEVVGKVHSQNNDFAPAFNVEIGNSDFLKLVYFEDSVDTSQLKYGDKITFKANMFDDRYYDATIVNIE